jgi:hypothetical protein
VAPSDSNYGVTEERPEAMILKDNPPDLTVNLLDEL